MPHPILILAGGIGLHWMLADLLVSSWWVPDLTLLAVILVVIASPTRWWLAASLAGLATMCRMAHCPAAALLWYGGLGLALRMCAAVWNLADQRILGSVVGLAEALWVGLLLWVQDGWHLAVLPPAAVHVALTVLLVRPGQRLLGLPNAERPS